MSMMSSLSWKTMPICSPKSAIRCWTSASHPATLAPNSTEVAISAAVLSETTCR
jgi:hypothetical protein